ALELDEILGVISIDTQTLLSRVWAGGLGAGYV
ncbi:hypothetical protein H632_c4749p0, partial [Helicosporidium sp. ATCC 50920]